MSAADATLASRPPQLPAVVVSQLPKPNPIRMKILSMGKEGVGKSCIIKRYCEERFIPKYITTIGIDYGVKRTTVDARECRVNFWDMAGGSEFLEIRNEFYKDAQGSILVYDVSDAQSFAHLELWLREAQKYGAKDLVYVVCANKVDVGKQRVVTEAEGRKWASGKGFAYFETSASSGQGIIAMFEQLFTDVVMLKK